MKKVYLCRKIAIGKNEVSRVSQGTLYVDVIILKPKL